MSIYSLRFLFLFLYMMNCALLSSSKSIKVREFENYYLGDMQFVDEDGNVNTIKEKYKNKRSIVIICSDTCKPCINQLKVFNFFEKKHPNKYNFLILSISDPIDMNVAIQENNIDALKVFYDRKMSFLKKINLNSIPIILFIDEENVLQDMVKGYINWNIESNKLLLDSYSNKNNNKIINNDEMKLSKLDDKNNIIKKNKKDKISKSNTMKEFIIYYKLSKTNKEE